MRELFRYCMAILSPIMIFSYAILSIIIPDNKEDGIFNDDFFWNVAIRNTWNMYPGQKWNFDEDKYSTLALNTYRNQSLQNGIVFYHPENSEPTQSFDIEQIISDLNLTKEKRVSVIAQELWVNWKKEKWEYAILAWIEWRYVWTLEQNQQIRSYLIRNAQEIYKEKHWWNEWNTLALVPQKVEKIQMNTKPIVWQTTYNWVTLNVSAPVDSFPEWTVLKIKTLQDDDSMTTFDITLKEVQLLAQVDSVEYDAPMASFDISFYAADDTLFLNELQPAEWKSISVTFNYTNNDEFKNPENDGFLAIYHMEENDVTSIANLVGVKEDTKSDSMSIYANTLSVYILTIVSDLDEEVLENSRTITFDAGDWGFIVDNEDIILSTLMDENSVCTWKILAKDNEITLPDVQIQSWYNFWWWYNKNGFLWKAWTKVELWDDNDSGVYACVYTQESEWNICGLNEALSESENSDFVSRNTADTNSYIPSEEEIKKYGEDVFIAYNWAIDNWITAIDNINKAKLNTEITRAELAKMMVVFMSDVLEKEPIITWEVNFRDVNSNKLWDLAWYIELAYQYQIMGINADWTPIEDFNPNKTVTRAEFATVLSRVLYGDTYNQTGAKYYERHIEALNKANILSDTDPHLTEWRWWIMTMLYRSQS